MYNRIIDLVILTPNEFVESLLPLQEHKEYTGIATSIVTLEEIYTNYPGRDEAEKVKYCLADYHSQNRIKYAMLVGDCDKFPVRYTCTDRKDEHSYNTAFYPADLYYADLYQPDGSFEDWDYTKDGYFGELHGESMTDLVNVDRVDLRPDIAVGRIPVSTAAEVDNYVAKVIAYEFNAYRATWAKSALLLATTDWLANACQIQDDIASQSLQGYSVTKAYTLGNPCLATPLPDPALINQTINSGIGLITYIGHGHSNGWHGIYNTHDMAGLTNIKRPTIAFAEACDTANYTTLPPYHPYKDIHGGHHPGSAHGEHFTVKPPQPACLQVQDNPESMAEAFLVSSKAGAVAYVGCVTGAQAWGIDLLKFFCEALQRQWATLGGMWNYMLTRYYQVHVIPHVISPPNWYKLAEVHQPWKFPLFGDPSLRLNGISRIQKRDFLGTYDMVHGHWRGTLVLETATDAWIEQTPNIVGKYIGTDGETFSVRGFVRTWSYPLPDSWGPDQQIILYIDFRRTPEERDDVKFQGYLCGERNAIAGNTWWRNTPYGFYAIKRSTITLEVYRRLDNRREGLSDDSERAIELHNRRKKALHSVLENQESWRVISWGQTDDETPHELVTLTLLVLVGEIFADEIIVTAVAGAVATKAIDVLFNVLIKAITRISKNTAVATAKIIIYIIYRLLQKQRDQEIEDYRIILKDISIWCRLEGETLVITIDDQQSGESHTVSYDLAEDKMISQENIVGIHIKPVDKEKGIISFVQAKRLENNCYQIISENSPYALGDTVKCIARVPIQEIEKDLPNEDKTTILLVRKA